MTFYFYLTGTFIPLQVRDFFPVHMSSCVFAGGPATATAIANTDTPTMGLSVLFLGI
jgi:hypothetical protein